MSEVNHPKQLEEGKEYEVVTRGFFEGTFVGYEGDEGDKIVVFDTGGTNAKGKPVRRRVRLHNYFTASRTTAQRRRDES